MESSMNDVRNDLIDEMLPEINFMSLNSRQTRRSEYSLPSSPQNSYHTNDYSHAFPSISPKLPPLNLTSKF